MLLAGLALGASKGFVYIRHEYHEQIRKVGEAIARARRLLPDAFDRFSLETFTSPGAYICGEESALIEAIEGKSAQPRNQPPSSRTNGLDDQPTLVNNVETFAWVPGILLGRTGWAGAKPRRFFSVSGDVDRPGVFEAEFASTTLGDLIDRAGGMRPRRAVKAGAPVRPAAAFTPRPV